MDDDSVPRFELPGFRFHPTEEELLDFYLRNIIFEKKLHSNVIGFLNIYRYDPWDLPGLAKIGEREWYFFVGRDRKHSNGGRPNRTTEHGFWKATGSDRKVVSLSEPKRVLGLRKTLVFYKGRAPRGTKTDWVMNEYRLSDNSSLPYPKDIVLCKVYRKATSLKVLEQWAANEEESTTTKAAPPQPQHSSSNTTHLTLFPTQPINSFHVEPGYLKVEDSEMAMDPHEFAELILQGDNKRSLKLPLGHEGPPKLQVPDCREWTQAQSQTQDGLWAQLCSPWLENILSQFTPTSTEILHF